jgi:hypothetical protein
MLSAALYARVRLTTLLHTRPRVQRAPGIPCALFLSGRMTLNTSGASRRGIAELHSVKATSLRAQRSNPSVRLLKHGLLRRFAPRNDEGFNSEQFATNGYCE